MFSAVNSFQYDYSVLYLIPDDVHSYGFCVFLCFLLAPFLLVLSFIINHYICPFNPLFFKKDLLLPLSLVCKAVLETIYIGIYKYK